MKKTILNESSSLHIVNRIMALTPGSKGIWGTMTANEMMFHCAKINREILKGKNNANKQTLKQRLLGLLVLQVMKGLPKGIKTNPKYVKPKDDETAFEELRNHLVESVNKVASHKEEIYGSHPFFGPLPTMQWRRFIFMHLDYHLRQFGV